MLLRRNWLRPIVDLKHRNGTFNTPGVFKRYSSDLKDLKSQADVFEIDSSASTTGVLDCETNKEVILYFDHIYSYAALRTLLAKLVRKLPRLVNDEGKLKTKVLNLCKAENNPLPEGTIIKELTQLSRDGGIFVKFGVPGTSSSKEVVSIICSNVREKNREADSNYLNYLTNKVIPWYPKAYPVKGIPWIEDLNRYPSSRIKVLFEGEKLTEEELYAIFRRYGPIYDLTAASSSVPHALVRYRKIRSAICAKNCLTGISLDSPKTTLHLRYDMIKGSSYITNFIVSHQGISIPLILALLATGAVLIFDPIRQWFIEERVSRRHSLESYMENRYFRLLYVPIRQIERWMNSGYAYLDEKMNIKVFQRGGPGNVEVDSGDYPDLFWSERQKKSKQLKLWIYENANTFIIVRGPQGSGKQEFVLENTLQKDETLRKKLLYLDCEQLLKARSEKELVKLTAHQLGYFPLFTWTSTMSQFIDLAVQGLTGQKSGFSETIETRLKSIFQLSAQALRNVALYDYGAYKEEAYKKLKKRALSNPQTEESHSLNEEDIIKEDDFLQMNPTAKPVVVLNGFGKTLEDKSDLVHSTIANWAASLIQHNIAHIIFITDDIGSLSYLNEVLPNQVFKTITLSDADEKNAEEYVLKQLKNENLDCAVLHKNLKPLGGRMLDLRAFIRRIKSGESSQEAVDEMVSQAAEQLTTFFLSSKVNNKSDGTWNSAQVWTIMKLLVSRGSIAYNDLVQQPLFKAIDETNFTLAALEKYDLISLQRIKGTLYAINIGRPIYKAAFLSLLENPNISQLYETECYSQMIKLENSKIAKLEDEIQRISKLQDMEVIRSRLKYIQEKLSAATANVTDYEQNIKNLDNKPSKKRSALSIF